MYEVDDEQLVALGRALYNPNDYFQRRTTKIRPLDRNSLSVEVSSELVVPKLEVTQIPKARSAEPMVDSRLARYLRRKGVLLAPVATAGQSPVGRSQRLVSLGIFKKSSQRLPDLKAGCNGRRIAVLGRHERADSMMRITLGGFREPTLEELRAEKKLAPEDDIVPFDSLPRETQSHIERWFIVINEEAEPEDAELHVAAFLEGLTTRDHVLSPAESWAQSPRVLEALDVASKDLHILGWVFAEEDERLVVDISYTHPLERPIRYWRDSSLSNKPPLWRWLFQPIRSVLRFLALRPLAVSLNEPGAEHVESMWLIVDAPPGTTVEDIYWEAVVLEAGQDEQEEEFGDSDDAAEWNYAYGYERGEVASLTTHRRDEGTVRKPRRVWFGLQMAPDTSTLWSGILVLTVAVVLAFVGVGRLLDDDASIVSNTLLLALPGLFAGVLRLLQPSVKTGATRGPRFLLGFVAIAPYVVAFLNQVQPIPSSFLGYEPSLTDFSKTLSSFSAGVALLFFFIAIPNRGPLIAHLKWSWLGNLPRWGPLKEFDGAGGLSEERRAHYKRADILATAKLACCLVGAILWWKLLF